MTSPYAVGILRLGGFAYTTTSRERAENRRSIDTMIKGMPLIPWVNVLTLAVLLSTPASILKAASYEVEPFWGFSMWFNQGRTDAYWPWEDHVFVGAYLDNNELNIYRGELWFDLPPMETAVISAELQFVPHVYAVGAWGYSNLRVYDVNGDYDKSDHTADRFDDLGTGNLYGEQIITESDSFNLVTISLSADAVDDLNAARAGTAPFRVGCAIDAGLTNLTNVEDEGNFGPNPPKLILETEAAPEPVVLRNLVLTNDTVTVSIQNIPSGQTVHLRQSADLVSFEPLSPPLDITGSTPQPLTVTIDPTVHPWLFMSVYEGASPAN